MRGFNIPVSRGEEQAYVFSKDIDLHYTVRKLVFFSYQDLPVFGFAFETIYNKFSSVSGVSFCVCVWEGENAFRELSLVSLERAIHPE